MYCSALQGTLTDYILEVRVINMVKEVHSTVNDAQDGHYVMKLSEASRKNVRRTGVKAANLGELIRARFTVPSGFVVTTDAFQAFLTKNAFGPDAPVEAVMTGVIPDDVVRALRSEVTKFEDVALVARSSGVAEDLPGASFAGQYVTVLDIHGIEALINAVRRCWASVFDKRVVAYRQARGQKGIALVAVLVQHFVRADAAGVAFTANPVTGDRGETMVSAVRGLGERLVSGQASPDEWIVKQGETICKNAPEGAIDANQADSVADLAKRVEAFFAGPQDIEWAIEGNQLFLLQARPITALPEQTQIPVPVQPPPGFWQREASHYPQPLSPMFRFLLAPFNASAKRAMNDFSVLVEGIEFKEIGGWVYQRMVPLGGKDSPVPPAWLMPLLIRIIPQIRSRIKGAVEAVRTDKAGAYIDRWYTEWKPEQIARIRKLRDVDLAGLSDEGLDSQISDVVSFFERSLDIHALLNGAVIVSLGEIAFVCKNLMGWDDKKTLDLFSGLSERSSAPARRLAELAQMARERPAIERLLNERIDKDTVKHLADVDRDFANAFAAYQREFGCRVLRLELVDPTLEETPELVLRLIRDQLARGYDPAADAALLERKRSAAIAEARLALSDRSAQERERFERALVRGERAYPIREDNQFYTVSAPMALVRYTILELGRRLAAMGQIAQQEDVFFLELEEAREALLNHSVQHTLVSRRKAEIEWVKAHPGPASYGNNPGPPPSFAALPAEARFLMEALTWAFNLILAAEHSGHKQQASTVLRGIAASPGTYSGHVRVIMNESEFGKLRPGDVMVCPTTSPVWSVLFPSVGALVTDTGGILSHPAIIAREYRVPAVVATGNATRILYDGQEVTVDGIAGTVELK